MRQPIDYLAVPAYTAQNTRLAALCCVFGMHQNQLICNNYYRFARGIREIGVPLYTIECVRAGEKFILPDDGTVMYRVAPTLGWHKERLLNILAKRVPPRFTKLATLDADIRFQDPAWAFETERELDRYAIVQPFETARWLDPYDNGLPQVSNSETLIVPGVVASGFRFGAAGMDSGRAHPGFAWAFRRDLWLNLGGLCDSLLNTGADEALVAAISNGIQRFSNLSQQYTLLPLFRNWFNNAVWCINHSATFVPGVVDHFWHGALGRRQYGSLPATILSLNHDWPRAIVEDQAGPGDLPRYTQDAALRAIYHRYYKFKDRFETTQ